MSRTIVEVNGTKYLMSEGVDLNALARAFRTARMLEYNWDSSKTKGPQYWIRNNPKFVVELDDDNNAAYEPTVKKEEFARPYPPIVAEGGEVVEAPSALNETQEQSSASF